MNKLAFLLVLTFALGSLATVDLDVSHCVRLYCTKDVKTKIRNAAGHGRFFPAEFDKDHGSYLITESEFEQAIDGCLGRGQIVSSKNLTTLPGTDAHKFEKIAPWVDVKSGGPVWRYINPKCQEMERRK